MQYSSQFKNIHSTQINHTIQPIQTLPVHDYKCGIYQGEYYKNHRQGKGLFYWYSGQIYIGEWLNDTIEGQGTIYFPYGGNFVGFFHNNKAEGAGILTMLDGSRIAGNWKYGRIEGNFVRYDAESDDWILLSSRNYYNINKQSSNYSYATGFSYQNNTQYQKQINSIYESIKQKIDTPYYRQMTERLDNHNLQMSSSLSQSNSALNLSQNNQPNYLHSQVNPADVDKFKIKLQQLDDEIYYHGIVRGSRPDGMGIMFSMNGRFSVRGKFANTKLNGPGRVELENGEIYDGVFRNGIISQGFYYSAKFNSYIYGQFRGEGDVRLDFKGKGYPYKLALENKNRTFPCMMIYKNTSEELIFLVQNDIKLLKMLDISKYVFSGTETSQTCSDQKLASANTFGYDNSLEDSYQSQDQSQGFSYTKNNVNIEDEEENHKYSISVPQKYTANQKQPKKQVNQELDQNFDDAFEQFIQIQQLDPKQSKLISDEYYSRRFDNEEENQEQYDNNQIEQHKQRQQYLLNSNNSNELFHSDFSSSKDDKLYVKKLLLHKINVEGIKQMGLEDLQIMNQLSEDIDKENISSSEVKISKLTSSSQLLQEKAQYYLNKARYLKLKIKLKEETQSVENKDEEEQIMKASNNDQQSHQQIYNQKRLQQTIDDKNDLSPEFFQSLDENKPYSIAVPLNKNTFGKSKKEERTINKNQKRGYQQKMDSYLDISQDIEMQMQNQNLNDIIQRQSGQSSEQNTSPNLINERILNTKKNQKEMKIFVHNNSYDNSPAQNHSQENDCHTNYSQDLIQDIGVYQNERNYDFKGINNQQQPNYKKKI